MVEQRAVFCQGCDAVVTVTERTCPGCHGDLVDPSLVGAGAS